MEKYTTAKDKDKEGNKNKTVINDDAYAICDLLDQLNKRLAMGKW